MVALHITGEGADRQPVFTEVAEGLEDELANNACRAPIARVYADAQDLRFGTGFVPGASAEPCLEEDSRHVAEQVRAGRSGSAHGACVPKADRTRQGDEQRHVRRVTAEACR